MFTNQKLTQYEEAMEMRDMQVINAWFACRAKGFNMTLKSIVDSMIPNPSN